MSNFQEFLPFISLGIVVITIGVLLKIYNEFVTVDKYERKNLQSCLYTLDMVNKKCVWVLAEMQAKFKEIGLSPKAEAELWMMMVYDIYMIAKIPGLQFNWKGRAWIGEILEHRRLYALTNSIHMITTMVAERSPEHLAEVINQFTKAHVQGRLADIPGSAQMLSSQFEEIAEEHRKKAEVSADDLRQGN